MTIPRKYLISIVIALFVGAGALVWSALPESCGSWHDRYQDALIHSIYGTSADDRAVAIIESQRPDGC